MKFISTLVFLLGLVLANPVNAEVKNFSQKKLCSLLESGDYNSIDRYKSATYCPNTHVKKVGMTILQYSKEKPNFSFLRGLCSNESNDLRVESGLPKAPVSTCLGVLEWSVKLKPELASATIKNVFDVFEKEASYSNTNLWMAATKKGFEIVASNSSLQGAGSWIPEHVQLSPEAQGYYLEAYGDKFAQRLVSTQDQLSPEVCSKAVAYAKRPTASFAIQMKRKSYGENYNVPKRCLSNDNVVASR